MTAHADVTQARPAREVLAWGRELVDPLLREAVDTLPPAMRRITGYHFGWWEADECPSAAGSAGGKAFRPALALLAAEAAGQDAASALPAAAAVELVHNFSLMQDDVIDGDLTRRHRPTAWSVFGPGQAIVAGDALLTLAFDVLSAAEPAGTRDGTQILHEAVLELMEGQHADLSFEERSDVGLAECLDMARGKSGALLGCACALGGWFGGARPGQVNQLRGFGVQLGVAFQLVDDLLGIWGDPEVTGKPVHADLHRRKKSLPVVAALTSGTAEAAELASLYYRDQPLSDAEVRRSADLVDRAGGRGWSQHRAGELLASALEQLHAAVPTTGPAGRATAELEGLAYLAVHRDS